MSNIVKRSVAVYGHKTSISLEDEFFADLKHVAAARRLTVAELVEHIDADRNTANLSSAIRVYLFELRGAPAQQSAAA